MIELIDISFKYNKNKSILEKANLSITKPGIYGLIGPNGAGKSTLLYLLTKLLTPDTGEIKLFGKQDYSLENVGFVQDNRVLYSYLSGQDHLDYIASIHNIDKNHVQHYIQKFQMEEYIHDAVSSYSLGMKQRLLLALSLIKNPTILFLDEPFNGLDPASTILIRESLKQLANKGTIVLISSHNLLEIDQMSTKTFFIKDKQLISHEYTYDMITVRVIPAQNTSEVLTTFLTANNFTHTKDSEGFLIEVNDINKLLQGIVQNNISIQSITEVASRIEEQYRQLFREDFNHEL